MKIQQKPFCLIVLLSLSMFTVIYYYRKLSVDTYTSANILQQLRSVSKEFNCFDLPKLAGENYTEKLNVLTKALDAHNSYLDSVRKKKTQIDRIRCMEGHVGHYIEEAYVLWEIAKLDQVKVICETGFNAGHSSLVWLMAKPNTKVYSFDLGRHTCSSDMAYVLQKMFPGRLKIIWGDSKVTLPKFHQSHPDIKCDLMSVDGGHTPSISQADMDAFMKMSNTKENLVLLDNHPDERYELNITWEGTKSRGLLQEMFRCSYQPLFPQGFSIGQFML